MNSSEKKSLISSLLETLGREKLGKPYGNEVMHNTGYTIYETDMEVLVAHDRTEVYDDSRLPEGVVIVVCHLNWLKATYDEIDRWLSKTLRYLQK